MRRKMMFGFQETHFVLLQGHTEAKYWPIDLTAALRNELGTNWCGLKTEVTSKCLDCFEFQTFQTLSKPVVVTVVDIVGHWKER